MHPPERGGAPQPRPQPPAQPPGHSPASRFEGPGGTERRRLEHDIARSGADPALQRRVLDRLDHLPAAEQAQERSMLQRISRGPNADRALHAYDEVGRVADSSPQARARLTPQVREALVRGVAEPRNGRDSLGTEGVMGVHQARTAAQAMATMPEDRYRQVTGLLDQAGRATPPSRGADAQGERALILSAVAARSEALRQPGAAGDTALGQVRGFANDVRGLPRDELMRTTTARDIDSRRSTSGVDPEHLDRADGRDRVRDNDGLIQRWDDSCAPTSGEIAAADADPVRARQLHHDGISHASTTGLPGRDQRTGLEANGGVAVARAQHDRARTGADHLRSALDTAHAPREQRQRIVDYLNGRLEGNPTARQAAQADLAAVQARSHGRLTDDDVQAIRQYRLGPTSAGVDGAAGLDSTASPSIHGRYSRQSVGATGMTAAQSDDMARRIRNGDDVGIRISDSAGTSGHMLMATDVRGEGANRRYLVSDPWSGRTAWISDRDLRSQNSRAFDREFGVGWNRVSDTYNPPE